VFAAYGWPGDLEDEQILERLLALNLERAGQAGVEVRSLRDKLNWEGDLDEMRQSRDR
jgi:hypothetical protein